MKRANRNAQNRAGADAPRPPSPGLQCYCIGAGPRLTALTAGLCQGPVFDHFRTAGVEVLLGLRAVLDAQIDVMTRQGRKGVKVPVE